MVERLYLAYTIADAEWLVSNFEILKLGIIVYSGVEPYLVFQSAKISAHDAVEFYQKLDFCRITNDVESLRIKFEQTLREVVPDYGISLIYKDIDLLSCSIHLLYYFFYEAVTSYYLAAAILQTYNPKEVWVNQSPLTPITQWGLAPPPQTNYENQVWGAMRREGIVVTTLGFPIVNSYSDTVKQHNLAEGVLNQHPSLQNTKRNLENQSFKSLQSDVLLVLQNNFIKNYASIGQALANSLNIITLDLNKENLWHGWCENSHSVHIPLIKDNNDISEIQINQLLEDQRFSDAFLDYPLDVWKIVKSRVNSLLRFDIPIVCSWIERSFWILKEVCPKFIIMAEEVSLPARTLGAIAQLHRIEKLVIEHGAPISFDNRISGKQRSDLCYWQRNYGETRPNYVAVWGAYAQQYYIKSLGWSTEQVIPTGWPWIEKEITKYLNNEKIKLDVHSELQMLFLSTSTYKFSYYLYETLFKAVKHFHALITIRPHGAEDINYLFELAQANSINIKIDKSSDLLHQIVASDIILGGATSVLSYAITLGKPCIFVDLLGMRDFMPYALEGAAIGVYDREELIPAIEKLLGDEEERHRQQETQRLFTQKYLGPLDGHASERIINFVKAKITSRVSSLSSSLADCSRLKTETDIMLRVDIGCGNSKPANFTGVDIYPGVGVDIVADLNKEFPFPDSSVDELRAHDIIEHLLDRIHTMNEIWRVCKPGAKVDIRVPSTDGRGAFQDPTHISFWNINSFLYYCNDYPPYIELCRQYGFKGEFKALTLEHEESSGNVIHVRVELLVAKPLSSLNTNKLIENNLINTPKYRQEIYRQSEDGFNNVTTQTEKDLSRIRLYIQQYQQDPNDRTTIADFRQIRYQVAIHWLNLPASQLESMYTGEMGKVYQTLLYANIKNEPLTATEQTFTNEVVTYLSKGFDEPKVLQYLLVAMLYCYADQLQLQYNISSIPQWLLNDYLKFLFSSQPYFQRIGEADSYYHYMQGWIDYLHASIISNPNSLLWHGIVAKLVQVTNFSHLYFSRANLKHIYVKRVEIIEVFLKHRNYNVDYEFADRPVSRKKIRMGILAAHFLPSAETFASLPIYEYISRDFEVILYSLNQTGHLLEQYCQSCANSFKLLPKDLADQVSLIRTDDLDILFIATNTTIIANQICLLSLNRLARMQVTSVASVVTTGMRNMDYYISGQLTDPLPNAEEHYQEKLVKLAGTAHCFSYGSEVEQATVKVERESLGISEEAVIFISGANFFKIIPELIDVWARIIAAVPNSVLLLLPFGPNWSSTYPKKAFVKHLSKEFLKHEVAAERVIVLDPQPVPNREDIKEFLKIADVYLDSYPFSGTTSLIEPLEVALPVVTLHGTYFRSVMGAAMLQALNVHDLVANSEESYIQLAITLGTDPELRQQKSEQIRQRMQDNPSFLDSRSYSARMGELLRNLFRKHQTTTFTKIFRLRDINLIIFPDWSCSEDELSRDVSDVIASLANHSNKNQITLLMATSNLSEDEVNLFLSSIFMHLLLEEGLDVADNLEISLVGKIGKPQWEALMSCLQGRVVLKSENQEAIVNSGAKSIPCFNIHNLRQVTNIST